MWVSQGRPWPRGGVWLVFSFLAGVVFFWGQPSWAQENPTGPVAGETRQSEVSRDQEPPPEPEDPTAPGFQAAPEIFRPPEPEPAASRSEPEKSRVQPASGGMPMVVSPNPSGPSEITIGGIFDFSGPTAEIGRDYAEGASAAAIYINNHGGVNGIPIRLITGDYASDPSKALGLYRTYRSQSKVSAILGWGTADARALLPLVTKDDVVYLSAAFDTQLANPAVAPNNFSIGSTYSDHARMAMSYAKENGAQRVVFIFPNHPYGLAPIKAGKEYARSMGLEIGPDISVDLRATDAISLLQPLKEFKPEFAWVGGVSPSIEVILRDAVKLGLETKFLINAWGLDSKFVKTAGRTAEGRANGFLVVRPFGYDVPEKEKIQSVVGNHLFSFHFNQAWAAMMVLWEGFKRAQAAGDATGPGLRRALETLKDFETGGLTPPLTFTPEDHRGTTTCGLYTVQDGQLVLAADVTIEREMEDLAR